MNPIFEAARTGDLETLKTFSLEEIKTTVNRHKSNAMHWAAGSGQIEIVKFLVEIGIPLNYANKQERNGLHWAAREGQVEMVNYFLDNGLAVDCLTKDGSTAFNWAVWKGRKEICEFLVSRGTNIHHVNYFGCNSGHWAAMGDATTEFLDYMKSLGVDFLLKNSMNHTPLGKAAFKGLKSTCDWILDNFGYEDLLTEDNNGKNAANQAKENGFLELTEYLNHLQETKLNVPVKQIENEVIKIETKAPKEKENETSKIENTTSEEIENETCKMENTASKERENETSKIENTASKERENETCKIENTAKDVETETTKIENAI